MDAHHFSEHEEMQRCLPDYFAAVEMEKFDNFLVNCVHHAISAFAFGEV